MVEATDKAKQLAEEEGVDLEAVQGTGKNGRVLVGDVREIIETKEYWDKYVKKARWSGHRQWVCTVTNYETLDKNRMQEHLVELERRGIIPLEEEDEDE